MLQMPPTEVGVYTKQVCSPNTFLDNAGQQRCCQDYGSELPTGKGILVTSSVIQELSTLSSYALGKYLFIVCQY